MSHKPRSASVFGERSQHEKCSGQIWQNEANERSRAGFGRTKPTCTASAPLAFGRSTLMWSPLTLMASTSAVPLLLASSGFARSGWVVSHRESDVAELQHPHHIRASDAALTLAASNSATAAGMKAYWALDDVITAATAAVVGLALWWIGFFALTLFDSAWSLIWLAWLRTHPRLAARRRQPSGSSPDDPLRPGGRIMFRRNALQLRHQLVAQRG